MKRKSMIALVIVMVLLVPIVSAFVNPLTAEGREARWRSKTRDYYKVLIDENIELFRNIDRVILKNPSLTLSTTRDLMNRFISILEPMYVTAILILGLYLIFFSGSPKNRAKAKSALLWSILGMCIITVSPYILMLLFDISEALTLSVLSWAPVDATTHFTHPVEYIFGMGADIIRHRVRGGVERPAIIFFLIAYALLMGTFLILELRYFLVALFSVAFPFTIFLYSLKPTKGIGRLMMEQTMLWTLAQAATALVFVIVAICMELADLTTIMTIPNGLKLIMELAGLVMLMVTPVMAARLFRGFLP